MTESTLDVEMNQKDGSLTLIAKQFMNGTQLLVDGTPPLIIDHVTVTRSELFNAQPTATSLEIWTGKRMQALVTFDEAEEDRVIDWIHTHLPEDAYTVYTDVAEQHETLRESRQNTDQGDVDSAACPEEVRDDD